MGNSASTDTEFRGCALILGHVDFGCSDLNRHGHDHDVKRLEPLLRSYRFTNVTVWKDPQNVEEKIAKFTAEDFSQFSALVVVVATHGDEGGLLKTHDGGEYRTSDVWNPLLAAQSLNGKPKILVFQACRSDGNLEVRGAEGDVCCVKVTSCLPPLPHQSSFLLCFSTPENRLCVRNETGSVYLQAWCSELEQAASRDSLYAVMTRVTDRVVKRKGVIPQTPCFVSFLLNDLYLPSRIRVSDSTESSQNGIRLQGSDSSARALSGAAQDGERVDALVGVLPDHCPPTGPSTSLNNTTGTTLSMVSKLPPHAHPSNGNVVSKPGPGVVTGSGEPLNGSSVQRDTALRSNGTTVPRENSEPAKKTSNGLVLSDYDASTRGLAVLLRPRGNTEESSVLEEQTDKLAAALRSRGFEVRVKTTDPMHHGRQIVNKLKQLRKKVVTRQKYSSLLVVTLGPLRRYSGEMTGPSARQGTVQWCLPSGQGSRWFHHVLPARLRRGNSTSHRLHQDHPVPLHKVWAAFRAATCPALKNRPKAFIFVDINTEMKDVAVPFISEVTVKEFKCKPTEHADLLLAKGFGTEYLNSLVWHLALAVDRCDLLNVLTTAARAVHLSLDPSCASESVTGRYHAHFESFLRACFVLPPLQSQVEESCMAAEGAQPAQNGVNHTRSSNGSGGAINLLHSSELGIGNWQLDEVFWRRASTCWVALVRQPNDCDLAIALELRKVQEDPFMIQLRNDIADGIRFTLTSSRRDSDGTIAIGFRPPGE